MYCILNLINACNSCEVTDREKLEYIYASSVEILMSYKQLLIKNEDKDKISAIIFTITTSMGKHLGKKKKLSYESAIKSLQSILSNVSEICVDNITVPSILNHAKNQKS